MKIAKLILIKIGFNKIVALVHAQHSQNIYVKLFNVNLNKFKDEMDIQH